MRKLSNGQLLNRAIQDQVKEYITRNQLEPGDLLPPEGQLAINLGVSRGSVREAIKALESLGIVEVRHGDGVRVRSLNMDSILDLLSYGAHFDPDRVVEILQIRIWLEDAAVADAVRVINADTIAAMRTVLDRWEKLVQSNADTANQDRKYHTLLYQGLGNESLSQLIDIFWSVYHSLPPEEIGSDSTPLATLDSHRQLLDAIEQHDIPLARERMRAHFRNLEDRIRRATERMQDKRRKRELLKEGE